MAQQIIIQDGRVGAGKKSACPSVEDLLVHKKFVTLLHPTLFKVKGIGEVPLHTPSSRRYKWKLRLQAHKKLPTQSWMGSGNKVFHTDNVSKLNRPEKTSLKATARGALPNK